MAELEGFKEAESMLIKLRDLAKEVITIIRDEAYNAHLDMKAIVQVNTKKTSELIICEDTPDGAKVHSQSEVSQILEYGSVYHDIYPRGPWRLHWVTKSGEDVYARHVHHPGTRPYPFFHPVRWASTIKIRQRIWEAFK